MLTSAMGALLKRAPLFCKVGTRETRSRGCEMESKRGVTGPLCARERAQCGPRPPPEVEVDRGRMYRGQLARISVEEPNPEERGRRRPIRRMWLTVRRDTERTHRRAVSREPGRPNRPIGFPRAENGKLPLGNVFVFTFCGTPRTTSFDFVKKFPA